jgi:hypothetical protein
MHSVDKWNSGLHHRVSIVDFLQRTKKHETRLARRTRALEDREDHVHTHGVKKKSLFFCLPCWQV